MFFFLFSVMFIVLFSAMFFFLFSAMFIFGQRADVAQDAYLCIDLGGLHFAFRDGMTIFTRLGAAVHHRDFRLRCGGGGAPRCLAFTRCGDAALIPE